MNYLPDFMTGLSGEDVERVMDLAEEISFPAESLIFAGGDRGDMFYIIDEGRVSICLDQDGTHHELR